MPASQRLVTVADVVPNAEYALQRTARRAALLPVKRLRRVALGPVCTFYFETYETILFQIQEMLLVEKAGPGQIADEIAAYNPLVPNGRELVATAMFEIDDPERRARTLARLGGVEDRFALEIGDERIAALADTDIERTRDDGKTSAVHFVRFPLTAEQAERFRDARVRVLLACDHPAYAHLAVLAPETRAELDKDLD